MVQRGRETSNTLFNELEQWEQYLKGENLDVHIIAFCDENERKKEKSAESSPIDQESQRQRSAPRLGGPS